MRFTCIQIDPSENIYMYRYTDLLDPMHGGISSIESEADLIDEDNYYRWIRGDGYQWFKDGSIYTVAFYESHPFFNCFVLDRTGMFGYNKYIPLQIVEEWLNKISKKKPIKRK
jgi:hypothetical protein